MSMDRCKQCDQAVDTDWDCCFYHDDEDGKEGTCKLCRQRNYDKRDLDNRMEAEQNERDRMREKYPQERHVEKFAQQERDYG